MIRFILLVIRGLCDAAGVPRVTAGALSVFVKVRNVCVASRVFY